MIKQYPTNYMSQEMRDRLESPEYTIAIYRHPENMEADYVLRDFIDFLERDSDEPSTDEELKHIKAWVTEYLGYNLQRVQKAEKAMLAKWIGE